MMQAPPPKKRINRKASQNLCSSTGELPLSWLYSLGHALFLFYQCKNNTQERLFRVERDNFIRHTNRNKKTSNGTKVYMRGRLPERA